MLPVKYEGVVIPSFEFFVLPTNSPVMSTNISNALGFKVLDSINNEVSINQIEPSTKT